MNILYLKDAPYRRGRPPCLPEQWRTTKRLYTPKALNAALLLAGVAAREIIQNLFQNLSKLL